MGLYGSEFRYRNHHLSRSRECDPSTMEPGCGNSDDLFIFCGHCSVYMNFYEGETLKGYWQCPECGAKVREITPYNRLGKENDKWLDDNGIEDGRWTSTKWKNFYD